MDYKAIYYKIIEKAKKETENGNRFVGYFEKHHIQPKSLGGTNDKENLVKLTAREHFICHWLLVKMYDKGTNERNKMLCALWRMRSNPFQNNIRYTNARTYEKLKIEYSKIISNQMHIIQMGKNNSQFGTKWYTNRNTGESKKFKEKPIDEFWIEGRNLFHGESSVLKIKLITLQHTETKVSQKSYLKSVDDAHKLWDEFHSGTYEKLDDFAKIHNKTRNAIFVKFKRYIPAFNTGKKRSCRSYKSNNTLIGKYE